MTPEDRNLVQELRTEAAAVMHGDLLVLISKKDVLLAADRLDALATRVEELEGQNKWNDSLSALSVGFAIGGDSSTDSSLIAPFADSPLKQAIRRAFDSPTIANIEAVANIWQPIESAPKRHHSVIDLWCVGEHDDVAFYCADYCATGRRVDGYHEYQGRVSNVWWRNGAWRPKSKLLLHAITVTPTHWMPLPDPPKVTP